MSCHSSKECIVDVLSFSHSPFFSFDRHYGFMICGLTPSRKLEQDDKRVESMRTVEMVGSGTEGQKGPRRGGRRVVTV